MNIIFILLLAIGGCCPSPILIEGDIVDDQVLHKLQSRDGRSRRSLENVHEHRWKHGTVPYRLSTDLGMNARLAIKDSIKEIERYTCVQFTPRTTERDYVEFINDEGCFSSIGRQYGRQVISIGDGCYSSIVVVIHELLHTLGMFHEQTRIDRNLYVQILWWNIQPDALKNYNTYDHGNFDTLRFPYDFLSATHYSKKDFSKNGQDTIQAIDRPFRSLGNKQGMSKLDRMKIFKYYKCYEKKESPIKAPCKDKISFCKYYTKHCKTKWFAEEYCQKTCVTCF